jgi:hypothetical protein
VQRVSEWVGNRTKAKDVISNTSDTQKQQLAGFIRELLMPSSIKSGLRGLTGQPGIDLVMATKIYRFCTPSTGAAVDRHCSQPSTDTARTFSTHYGIDARPEQRPAPNSAVNGQMASTKRHAWQPSLMLDATGIYFNISSPIFRSWRPLQIH